MKKIKILVLSNTAWNNNNSFGNSYSSIFGGMEDQVEIANIYCQAGTPENKIVSRHFQINEKQLLNNILDKKKTVGVEVNNTTKPFRLSKQNEKFFNLARIYRFQILFWIRDLIWQLGRWKSPELKNFITDFNPDIIWLPFYSSFHINRIAYFIKLYTNKPMVGYVSDDIYTLKQFSLSPLYWIDRLLKRVSIKRAVSACEKLYVISELQKIDYDKCFSRNCDILFKGDQFSHPKEEYLRSTHKLEFVYTGNIGDGRWKTLALLANLIRKSGGDFHLTTYTPTPITRKIKRGLEIKGYSKIMPPVSADEIKQIQANGDVLIHVEPLNLNGICTVRHSFSTKIVDYFSQGKCILAIGSKRVASIKYLVDNDAALVAESEKELLLLLNRLSDDSELVAKYASKAWMCGKKNHQIKDIHDMIYRDLIKINGKS